MSEAFPSDRKNSGATECDDRNRCAGQETNTAARKLHRRGKNIHTRWHRRFGSGTLSRPSQRASLFAMVVACIGHGGEARADDLGNYTLPLLREHAGERIGPPQSALEGEAANGPPPHIESDNCDAVTSTVESFIGA